MRKQENKKKQYVRPAAELTQVTYGALLVESPPANPKGGENGKISVEGSEILKDEEITLESKSNTYNVWE